MKLTLLSKRTILWSVSKRIFFYNKPQASIHKDLRWLTFSYSYRALPSLSRLHWPHQKLRAMTGSRSAHTKCERDGAAWASRERNKRESERERERLNWRTWTHMNDPQFVSGARDVMSLYVSLAFSRAGSGNLLWKCNLVKLKVTEIAVTSVTSVIQVTLYVIKILQNVTVLS